MKHQILYALALLVVSTMGCSRDNPLTPQENPNLLANSEFRTSLTSIQDITTGSVESWARGTRSPQIAAGFGCGDTTRGYIQMWGNATLGESVTQTLATPIKKGRTYIVTACVKWWNDNPDNYTQHVKVRFVAFNQPPITSNHWQENKPNVAVIGSIKTSDTLWRTLSTAEWTADSDYTGFSMNVENETPDDGTPFTVSWGHIDNVTLREKSTEAK
jgi:hypothetical protein